ncbi:MAG: exopolysaccharide biosynthesis protein [Pseudomonadota bacterium]
MTHLTMDTTEHRTAFDQIEAVLSDAQISGSSSVTLGTFTGALEERAFGLLMLALALPCCLPFVYLIPQIVALPMLVLTGQMAAGRQAPWLPTTLRTRQIDIAAMQSVVGRGRKWFGWAERFARPRLLALSSPLASRVIGALLLVPSASILLPIPSTNTVPGIGVAIASIGLIERDGLLIIAGLLVGLAWVVFLLVSAPLLALWLIGLFGS